MDGRARMSDDSAPLVTVVTPVYNNAAYLAECIESIRAQTYPNWEYVIVNNRSTDGTREIAHRYAAQDKRIRVHDNETFLPIIANHNSALRRISPDSKYCKLVFADDWIFARCLEEMVSVAEKHPSAAFVSCYGLDGQNVVWDGLPYPGQLTPGKDICRRYFLHGLYVFGTGTSILYRSDVVRCCDPFYNESNTHADTESCVSLLRDHDFGFVHQVLAFTRHRADSQFHGDLRANTVVAARLLELTRYGRDFLSHEELSLCIDRKLDEYYNFLAVSVIRGNRDRAFWTFHRSWLAAYGGGFSALRLAGAIAARFLRAASNPFETVEKLKKALARRH